MRRTEVEGMKGNKMATDFAPNGANCQTRQRESGRRELVVFILTCP